MVSYARNVKGWIFRGFVKEHLVPHLESGDVVVWDNARIHGVEGIRGMTRARRGAAAAAATLQPGPESD